MDSNIKVQVKCTGCGGTGWITRDPDIGTDQACPVCDGTRHITLETTTEDLFTTLFDVAMERHTNGK